MTHFSNKQLLTIGDGLLRIEKHEVISLASRYINKLPHTLNNLIDTLIDRGVYSEEEIREQLFAKVKLLLPKLAELIEDRYFLENELLYRYQTNRYSYYSAESTNELASAKNQLTMLLDDLKQIQQISVVQNNYVEQLIKSVENLLESHLPSKEIFYIID